MTALEGVARDPSRLAARRTLARLLAPLLAHDRDSAAAAVLLVQGRLGNAWEGVESGVGVETLRLAVEQLAGDRLVVGAWQATTTVIGDAGAAAGRLVRSSLPTATASAPPPAVPLSTLLQQLRTLAAESGAGSRQRKVDAVAALLRGCGSEAEVTYMARILLGTLRSGVGQDTLVGALALAADAVTHGGTTIDAAAKAPPPAVAAIKLALGANPDWTALVHTLAAPPAAAPTSTPSSDAAAADTIAPVQSMAARPAAGIEEVVRRMAGCSVVAEWKYDGERAQVHWRRDGGAHVYSRNLEDVTAKQASVSTAVGGGAAADVTSAILDGEVVAVDSTTGAMLPFQVLTTRSRKGSASSRAPGPAVEYVAFDLLALHRTSLLAQPLSARRATLARHFAPAPGFRLAAARVLDLPSDAAAPAAAAAVRSAFDDAVGGGAEGIMVKRGDGVYEAGTRSLSWLKLKRDYIDGLGDSFDLVPVGAWRGRGKRRATYGSFLMAAYNPARRLWETAGRVGTGFTDAELGDATARLDALLVGGGGGTSCPPDVAAAPDETPDVWFPPAASEVWEVAAYDLSRSPAAMAGGADAPPGLLGAGKRGIALRFPRFVRRRPDKTPVHATTTPDLVALLISRTSGGGALTEAAAAADDDAVAAK